ncbi:MAG: hypothetical protein H7833_09940 [Magnetococcus sp. DMHC-1]
MAKLSEVTIDWDESQPTPGKTRSNLYFFPNLTRRDAALAAPDGVPPRQPLALLDKDVAAPTLEERVAAIVARLWRENPSGLLQPMAGAWRSPAAGKVTDTFSPPDAAAKWAKRKKQVSHPAVLAAMAAFMKQAVQSVPLPDPLPATRTRQPVPNLPEPMAAPATTVAVQSIPMEPSGPLAEPIVATVAMHPIPVMTSGPEMATLLVTASVHTVQADAPEPTIEPFPTLIVPDRIPLDEPGPTGEPFPTLFSPERIQPNPSGPAVEFLPTRVMPERIPLDGPEPVVASQPAHTVPDVDPIVQSEPVVASQPTHTVPDVDPIAQPELVDGPYLTLTVLDMIHVDQLEPNVDPFSAQVPVSSQVQDPAPAVTATPPLQETRTSFRDHASFPEMAPPEMTLSEMALPGRKESPTSAHPRGLHSLEEKAFWKKSLDWDLQPDPKPVRNPIRPKPLHQKMNPKPVRNHPDLDLETILQPVRGKPNLNPQPGRKQNKMDPYLDLDLDLEQILEPVRTKAILNPQPGRRQNKMDPYLDLDLDLEQIPEPVRTKTLQSPQPGRRQEKMALDPGLEQIPEPVRTKTLQNPQPGRRQEKMALDLDLDQATSPGWSHWGSAFLSASRNLFKATLNWYRERFGKKSS